MDDFAAQWLNLRRVERGGRPSGFVSQLRRQPAGGVQTGNRAVRRQHAARGSQRPGSAARELHVRQRAAGAALRHSGNLRQPLPPRHAAEPRSTRRVARARRAAGDDLVSRSDIAGPARQMAAEQHLWLARSAAPSRRGHQSGGNQARSRAGVDTRTAGATSEESRRAQLSFRDRSAGVRAGELRRHRRVADG